MHRNKVDYITIRMAMVEGARTREEVADKAGADTVEKVGEVTGAGTGVDEVTGEECGKCKGLIQNIIDLGR